MDELDKKLFKTLALRVAFGKSGTNNNSFMKLLDKIDTMMYQYDNELYKEALRGEKNA
jgi:hypothetical protein